MLSNDIHKQLIEFGQQKATLPMAKRFGVHFEYDDLVAKLQTLQAAEPSIESPVKVAPPGLAHKLQRPKARIVIRAARLRPQQLLRTKQGSLLRQRTGLSVEGKTMSLFSTRSR